jgi:flagellar FliL protein
MSATRTTPVSSKTASGKPGGSANEEGEGEVAKKASPLKNKKVLIGIVALLAIAGGVYQTMFAPKPKPAPPSGGDIVALDPTTLNLADGHYLKIALGVQLVKGKATLADFQNSQAQALVISEFSDRSVDSLSSNAARAKLSDDLLAKLKKAYPDKVFGVYITQFVTQ